MCSISGCDWPKFPRAHGESKGSTIWLKAIGQCLKPKKCHLVKQEVKFLGYVVSSARVSADLDKVRIIQDFPTPKNLKQLRSFLGLASVV